MQDEPDTQSLDASAPDPTAGEHEGTTVQLGTAFAILEAVQDLPERERQRRIVELCGDDQTLRQQVRQLLWLPDPVTGMDLEALKNRRGAFGRYRITGFVGLGGMGVVYSAEQDEPARNVALKLLHPGPVSDAMLRRFRREASLLAQLDHPTVARIYDAGVAETGLGREPFLAMELVLGQPILLATETMDVPQKVRLLSRVCDGIDHAHRRGVIHRDLKPDNVLVEETPDGPVPRILDFGIAIALGEHGDSRMTASRHLVGTLAYMSPEQANGRVDARSDVYALGALGYQILAGEPPLQLRDLGILAAIRSIGERDPRPLGRFGQGLRGDLEAVMAKALAKDPDQRYASAAELGADLKRHLQRKPVLARRQTPLYLLGRFARRHRLVVGLSSVLAASFVIGVISTAQASLRATHSADQLTELSAVLIGEVLDHLDQTSGTSEVRRRILAESQDKIEALLRDRPDHPLLLRTKAALLTYQGNLLRDQGNLEDALPRRQEALDLRRRLLAGSPDDPALLRGVAMAQSLLGDSLRQQSETAAAREQYEEVLPTYRTLVGHNPDRRQALDDLAWSYLRLADVAREQGRTADSDSYLAEARPLVEVLVQQYRLHEGTLILCRQMSGVDARLAEQKGDLEGTFEHQRMGLVYARQLRTIRPGFFAHQEMHATSALALAGLARRTGRLEDAREALLESQGAAEDLLRANPDHLRTLELSVAFQCEAARLALERQEPRQAMLCVNRAYSPLMQFCQRAHAVADRGQLALSLLETVHELWPSDPRMSPGSALPLGPMPMSTQPEIDAITRACTASILLFHGDKTLGEVARLLDGAESDLPGIAFFLELCRARLLERRDGCSAAIGRLEQILAMPLAESHADLVRRDLQRLRSRK